MHGLAFGLFCFFPFLFFLSFFDFLSLDFLTAGDGHPFAIALCKEPERFPRFSARILKLLDEFLELLREDGLEELLERLDLKEERSLEPALREHDDSC